MCGSNAGAHPLGPRGIYERAEVTTGDELSEREKQVLFLAMRGFTARQTGVILDIKLATVKSYRQAILRKMGVNDMVSAAMLWLSGVR